MAERGEHPTEPERSGWPIPFTEDEPLRMWRGLGYWINTGATDIRLDMRPVPHTGELPPRAGDDDGQTA